nr:hypothetical protein Iba_chr10dCG10830 [Ipomoea batatas]
MLCFLILDRRPDSQFDCILSSFISFIAPCKSPSDLDLEFWIWVDSDDGTPSSATKTTIGRDGDFFTPGQAFRANRKVEEDDGEILNKQRFRRPFSSSGDSSSDSKLPLIFRQRQQAQTHFQATYGASGDSWATKMM